ncbi:S-layer homology domain-containing protein [Lysinibacillus xylanilyticus]|uniref:S-layer homology domain-containing protein n=1 Tax=Lysinibacillus xylanilyticus TaxID=582475 RepID=UPI003CFD63CF
MDKTKIQKVNKALIATVFATSGIAVVVPLPQKAAAATSPFTDIDQYSSHYDNILKLYSQGAISGYADKTFRPNQNVTRGQAAKMLATVLNLDLKNVQDPYFKDVPQSSEYYKYVAALQNAGIMSGYSNGTFMPNEVITRGQLAKILVLGFKFEVASNYNHSFKDVTSQTSNAIYIQTLVDLNITAGTTPVTFSPFDAVTRGQIASFIVRSQEKKSNATTFKITGVEDDVVYINGEPYSVPESLSHIFNEYNAPVLKGAFIEGDLSGKTIRSVSKLTLNASGTSSRFLEFDGDHESFGATIVVNGNYIEFSNVTLTGTMYVNETVRPPLHMSVSDYNPLSIGRIASNNFSFIDWTNPENPNGENPPPSKNGPTTDFENWTDQNSDKNPDKNKPFENWSKDKVTMKNVEKHIEFYNSTVSRLVVSQSGTKIETNMKLPRVDIIRNVREFEIQGNIGTLNLDTDTKLTIYGDGNIDWINYNSYTDLELYLDGRVGTLYVDNAYGWVDIGDYTYIDKVIIPKGESPNNIFDDFLEDKDNIGIITDPDGKPIDKDDYDNQKPTDKTKPLIDITKVTTLNGSDAQVDFTSDEVGTYYYIVREKGADAPTKREMVERISTENAASGTGAAVKGTNTVKVTNLGEKKEYVVYVMVVDGAKNASDIKSQAFQMKDGSPPSVKSLTVTPLPGGTRAELKFTASEPGEYYYYVRKKTTAADPTTADIIAKPTGKGKAVAGKLGITEILTGLDANTDYQVYVVMKDDSGNNSKDPAASAQFGTLQLDNEPPYLISKELKRISEYSNEFYIDFNEELDKGTAEDVNNYNLNGTVIVSIEGQPKIVKPETAKYEKTSTGSRVTLKIPSNTGFVNGDNLIVTVLPGVKDLAGNEFENNTNLPSNIEKPRNSAEYIYRNTGEPVLNFIGKPIVNSEKTRAVVNFNASRAGTYHYVIMKSGIDTKKIDGRLLINAIQDEASFLEVDGEKVDIKGSKGNDPANLGDQPITVPFPPAASLSPFESYSIYMVLRDRSGNISQVKSLELIGDKTAPYISDTALKMNEGDTSGSFKFSSNEAGFYHYIIRKKYSDTDPTVLNPVPTEEEIFSTKGTTMRVGENTINFKDLQRHEDYVIYVGVSDNFGNKTLLKELTYDSDGNITGSKGKIGQDFFSDGTKPRVEDPIFKRIDEKTFEVTFSEAVGDPNNQGGIIDNNIPFFKLTNLDGTTATLPSHTWAWEEGSDTKNTWDPRKLILTFTKPVEQSFALTVDPNITDIGSAINKGHLFSDGKPTASYISRTLKTEIESAQLKDPIEVNSKGDRSPNIKVTFDFTFNDPSIVEGEMVNFYYKAYTKEYDKQSPNPVKNVTEEEIIIPNTPNALRSLNDGNGKAKFEGGRVVASISHKSAPFIEGDYIVLVLVDKYGNKYKVLGNISK